MNREQYMNILKKRLKRLPREEFDRAVAYFEEYFEDAGAAYEQQAIEDLGTPEEAANQIICNIAIKNTNEPVTDVKKGVSAVWVGILAVCAAPVALPLFLLACALFLMLFAVSFMLFAVFIACGVMVVIMGPISICGGFTLITESIPAALICFGNGLTEIGIGLLLVWGMYLLGRKIMQWLIQLFGKIAKKGGK